MELIMKNMSLFEKVLRKASVLVLSAGIVCSLSLTGCAGSNKKDKDEGKSKTTTTSSNSGNESGSDKASDSTDAEVINPDVKRSDYSNRAAYKLAREGKCTMHKGEVTQIPKEEGETVELASSDDSIVSVDENGQIYSKKRGDVTITAKYSNGETKEYSVKVRKKGFEFFDYEILTTEKLEIKMGFSNRLEGVKWESSDKSIVKVNKKGYAVAKKPGNVMLTAKYKGHIYYCNMNSVKKPESIIYLTFDDGPSPNITPKILDILKKNDVHATFFELRPASTDYDVTQRVVDEGHTLALHGFEHKYDKIYTSVDYYHNNLLKLQKLFHDKFGVWCTLSRFPGGSSNTVSKYNPGVMTKITSKMDDWDFIYVDWNVSSGDAGQEVTEKGVYNSITQQVAKGRSNVVLMHDSPPKIYTLKALDKVIKYGKKHGYTFRGLSPSSVEVHHGVNN